MQAVLGAEQDRVQVLDWGPASEIPLAAVDPKMTLTQVTMPTPPSEESGKEENNETDRGRYEVRHE